MVVVGTGILGGFLMGICFMGLFDWVRERVLSSEFIRNVLTLLSGTLVAQVVSFGLYPVLGYLYSPEEFGVVGIFVALVATFAVGANGGYEVAVMLPKDDRGSIRLVWICLGIGMVVVGIVGTLFGLLGEILLGWFDVIELWRYWWLLPFSLLLECIQQPLRTLLNRLKFYRVLSYGKVVQALGNVFLSVYLGWLGWGFEGLIFGFVLGQLGSTLVLGYSGVKWLLEVGYWPSWEELLGEGWLYREFPMYSLWATWLNTFSRQLPFFLLAPFFGKSAAGFYEMATRILNKPYGLLSRSIAEVFYEKATKAKDKGLDALGAITWGTFQSLFLLGLPGLIIVSAVGPWLFSFVFGDEWLMAGVYARWLMPWVFLMFIVSPLSYLIDIQMRLRFLLFYNIGLFVVRLLTLYVGGLYFGDVFTIQLYGLGGFLMVGFHLLFLLKIGGVLGNSGKDIA